MYRRRKVFCIEFSMQCCTLRPKTQDEGPVYGAYKTTSATILHRFSVSHTLCIPVSMLVLGYKARGMMNLHVEDGVSELAQH